MEVERSRADDRFAMLPWERLRDKIVTLDGKPYAAYKTLEGAYRFEKFILFVDEVAVDPPGAPVPIRVRVDQAEARFPHELWSVPVRKAAMEDFIARRWLESARRVGRSRGGRGAIGIEAGAQQVLARSACVLAEDFVEVRAYLTLPSEGRKALAKPVQALLLEDLPQVTDGSLLYAGLNPQNAQRHVEVSEDASALRAQLSEHGLVAFIAEGAVLPREGDSERPLLSHLVTFRAPEELRIALSSPHRGEIAGLGIPRGVTVILGSAFSGRSTLLRAIAAGVYNHVPGDGREYCVALPDAVMVQIDPGRRVEGVNLAPFISSLPGGEDVTRYRGEHVNALVSQAACINEMLETGTSLLLADEDTSAPGMLTRDVMWRHLAPEVKDPVTPLADLLRSLYAEHGVSSIVVGASGSSLPSIADTVLGMDGFRPAVLTSRAKQIAAEWPGARAAETRGFGGIHHRIPLGDSLGFLRGRKYRPEAPSVRSLTLSRELIDLHALPAVVDPAQTKAIGAALVHAVDRGYFDGSRTIREVMSLLEADLSAGGLDALSMHEFPAGEYALPRRQEIAAALNRLRMLRVKT